MKNFAKIILLTLFFVVVNNYKAAAAPGVTGGKDNNDTSGLKSNIIIFNMITPAAPAAPAKSKTLKKAGSVARTSNSHSDASPKPLPGES